MKTILVTGAAGFIGSQLTKRLQDSGFEVEGIDNFNQHLYDPSLKADRVKHFGITVHNCDLRDQIHTEAIIQRLKPDTIIHLAAMAGVRDSLGKEKSYHANHSESTQKLIDACKRQVTAGHIDEASPCCDNGC